MIISYALSTKSPRFLKSIERPSLKCYFENAGCIERPGRSWGRIGNTRNHEKPKIIVLRIGGRQLVVSRPPHLFYANFLVRLIGCQHAPNRSNGNVDMDLASDFHGRIVCAPRCIESREKPERWRSSQRWRPAEI